MAKKYVQIPTAYLSGAGVIIGATSVTINSFTDIYGNVLTMTDFGDTGYCTVEPDTTNEESFTFTSITANANGTVTLGGIKTSLAKSPYTETTGLLRAHVGGSKVVVSDTAAFWNTFANKYNDETIIGRWGSATVPVNPNDYTNKQYVDSAATGGATFNAEIVVGVAGENLTSGKVVYLNMTDSKWYTADSSVASKSVGVLLGIAQVTVTTGNSINVLLSGEDQKQTALTANSVYYLSTAGGISTTKGANIRIVGRTKSGSTTNFLVDFTNDPNVSLIDGSRTYAADTGAANAYVITLVPAITAADLKAGFVCSFIATNANTTASTINVNGIGAKTIKKAGGATDLVAGDIAAGMIVQCEYDGTNFIMLNPVANTVIPKFGGNGADGALTVTSGTTNIDVGAVRYFVKNYTSISITGTGKVTFSNPHVNGTIIILKSQGAVTLTSSQTPMLDASGMGAVGGAAVVRGTAGVTVGNNGTDGWGTIWKTNLGSGSTNAAVGNGGAASSSIKTYEEFSQVVKYQDIFVGAGGGSGFVDCSSTGTSQTGGRGGGALLIECAGAWNFTTASGISVAGGNPTGSVTGSGGSTGSSGGGGGGYFRGIYNTLIANSGTVTISGGTGGNCFYASGSPSYGAGGGASGKTAGSNGTTSTTNGAKTGGDGAVGFSSIGANTEYA